MTMRSGTYKTDFSSGRHVKPVLVIGTGSVGSRHLEVLHHLLDLSPVALPKRPERYAELEKRGVRVAKSVQQAAKAGIRHCIVATDTAKHLDDSILALENGFEVLIEKPLAVNAKDARAICETATRLGRQVFVGCCLRFSASLNSFRDLLGRLGKIHAVRIECQSYLPEWRPERPYQQSYSARADEGGVLRDLIHEIDYAGWIFGWPSALQARICNLGRLGIAAEEAADLIWETNDGCLVSIRLDYLSKPAQRRMTAYGEEGTIEWNGVRNMVALRFGEEIPKTFVSSQTRNEMICDQARAFLGATYGESDFRLATGLDGVRALAVCDTARFASEMRREEKVEYQ